MEFVGGMTLMGLAGYMFLERVVVSSNLFTLFGFSAHGALLLLVGLGMVLLFLNSKNTLG